VKGRRSHAKCGAVAQKALDRRCHSALAPTDESVAWCAYDCALAGHSLDR
jgi:hypothetical protein